MPDSQPKRDREPHTNQLRESGLRKGPGANRVTVLLLLSTLTCPGCGGSGKKQIAPVSGVVTLDDQPLTEGFVLVTPTDGKMAKGAIRSDGTFVLGTEANTDGTRIGTHPVSIQPPPAQKGMPLSDMAKKLPEQYTKESTFGITVEMKSNTDNDLPIKLTTDRL